MKKLRGSLAAKTVAVILLAFCCAGLLCSVFGIWFLDEMNAYTENEQSIQDRLREQYLDQHLGELTDYLYNGLAPDQYESDAFCFELLDEDQNVLYGNWNGSNPVKAIMSNVSGWYGGFCYWGSDLPLTTGPEKAPMPREELALDRPMPTPDPVTESGETADSTAEAETEGVAGVPVAYIRLYLITDDLGRAQNTEVTLYKLLYPARYGLIALAVVCLILAVLLFLFLMNAAGHHDDSDQVTPSFTDKLPLEILAAFCIAGIVGLIYIIGGSNYYSDAITVTIVALCLVGIGLLALLLLMSLAVRLKLGILLQSSLIYRILRWCWRVAKGFFLGVGRLLSALPLVWKWVPLYVIFFFADFAFTMANLRDGGPLALGLMVKWGLLGAVLLYLILCFSKLRRGAREIASGNEDATVDTIYMRGQLKAHGEDLNHIRDGLSRAVDERMKSERFRTELITNVSHDIKTPLTSIINYVDLLSREEIENENAKEYIEVLQRQSTRLKKLTDDLVEASKASTGNLPVAPERCELGVLLEQAAGEYGERLTQQQLELRVKKPDSPVPVMADPRHLWRILDNLMNNILKYAQPGTRVYLDLEQDGVRASLSFRNISRYPLNVKAEELTERFVRGDSSRSTEGSGLGLAIASSLAKLQNIDMSVTVDGDLFKVVLDFPVAR